MQTVSFSVVYESLVNGVKEIEKNKDYLDDLDGIIGDSDHGETVSFAFRKALEKVDENLPREDIGELFKIFGQELVFSGGGAMGPLYGTAFMDAGKMLLGKSEISSKDLVKFLSGFAQGIKRRGKCEVGEKTMYDTIYPAKEKGEKSLSSGKSLEEIIQDVLSAAKKGMESTKDMISKRGRSSRLGERTLGHKDPGAVSLYIFLDTFLKGLI